MQYYARNVLLFASLLLAIESVLESAPITDNPWDLNGACQVHVEKFAVVQANMVQCATNWSIPPKVCTNCWEQYIAFKQVEYETKNLANISSLDNRTCTQVIYDNYLLSYSNDISEALSSNIWAKSRCDACITITWNFTANDSRVDFANRTVLFQDKLFDWRDCVANYTGDFSHNGTICQYCKKPFNDLFSYYWEIYVEPGVEFCVDVETTMNDTIHLWNDVWQCAEKKDRKRDTAMVLVTMGVLLIITSLFYASSYIQGGGQARRFIRYSWSTPEQGRSRLLSSSTSDNNLSSSAYSIC
ncbi:unnamed protein product [Nippostrongylus brasiliensis]|uniref:Osteopetrosis-associated transmembrane protein 1 (inferred by orthology to a human protein) n=1 Tax=Nippostrongylus brasiliensis TaxID=27835 RepID=A0A0N4Y3N3_NIPBR|nr:hypothetical protein Q1695_012425 [Nippostrongylus brasiliensis]VDL74022.1 unnamed protein product [Nippostrongylus brasiliensis]